MGRDYADLRTEGDAPGQALASASVDASGTEDLDLSTVLGVRGRESGSLGSRAP